MASEPSKASSGYPDDDLASAWFLDAKLGSSTKNLVRERIAFVDATSPDRHYEDLRRRHKPINRVEAKRNEDNGPSDAATTTTTRSTPRVDGLPTPKIVLYSADRVETSWKGPKRIGAGLSNLGNTCFLNSVLQCLTYTPPLINYMSEGEHVGSCRVRGFCVLCELHRHMLDALSRAGQAIQPLGIVSKLKHIARHLRVGHQEDAHEFLRYLIDGMQKACLAGFQSNLDRASQETTAIHQIFGGYYRSQVICLQCRHESNTFEPLLDLSLNIKNCFTLKKALERYIEPEILDDSNKYLCSKCKQKRRAQKRLTIHHPPRVLTIQLKRFDFSSMFGFKVSKDVKFEDALDLRPFMSQKNGPKELYHLNAVLVHSGYSCNSGHYYSFVKSPAGFWYSMNDSHVRQVSQQTVFSQQAYLLFYCHTKPKNHHQQQPLQRSQMTSNRSPTPVRAPVSNSLPPSKEKTTKIVQPVKPRIISESTTASKSSSTSNQPTALKIQKFAIKIKKQPKPSWEEALTGKKAEKPYTNKDDASKSAIQPVSPPSAKDAENVSVVLPQQTKRLGKAKVIFSPQVQKPTAIVSPSVTSSPSPSKATSTPSDFASNAKSVSPLVATTKAEAQSDASSEGLKALKSYESPDSEIRRSPSPAQIVPATSTTSGSPEKVEEAEGEQRYGPEEPSCVEKKEKKKKKHKKKKKKKRGDDGYEEEIVEERKRRRSGSRRSRSLSVEKKTERQRRSRSASSDREPERKRRDDGESSRSSERRRRKKKRKRSRDESRSRSPSERKRTRRASESRSERKETRRESRDRKRERSRSRSTSPEKRSHGKKEVEKVKYVDGTVCVVVDKTTRCEKDKADVVGVLTASTGHGYGKSVESWEGGPSRVDSAADVDDLRRSNRDDWDDEYDKGRAKKVKSARRQFAGQSSKNEFQDIQSKRNKVYTGSKHRLDENRRQDHGRHRGHNRHHHHYHRHYTGKR
ncbi:ubiquitin carboxyl-terminal hydrolase 36-like isoform X2 [Oscarella lobularis]|uniref:ubiquitin carboxyl-terminal hydrolase 36-like isoform X2 n=1 Tax=Oscarella lobularis TaxID=121494 RepID=UPI003313600B